MRRLYHFATSPYSRRARLALAHKGLDVTLIDARADPTKLDEARTQTPLKTMPLLVEADGRALGDSGAIAHYLERAHPQAPALFPSAAEDAFVVFEAMALVDAALQSLVDVGNRYYPLHGAPEFAAIEGEMRERIQRALDGLAARATRPTLARAGWSAGDIWLFTLVDWLAGLPARAIDNPVVAQIVTVGWRLPAGLSSWAAQHRARDDVKALG
ncbi:MAG: hypothetical protein NVS3B10_03000 [Polyangiales bacterium]